MVIRLESLVVLGEASGSASFAAAVGRSLFDAKISVPRARPGAVSRGSLIRTARTSQRPVVAVTAPAGYGKSTLLAEWAQAEDRPVAWASLDTFDDDPAALLGLLASAYERTVPGNVGIWSKTWAVSGVRRWAAPRRVWLPRSMPARLRSS